MLTRASHPIPTTRLFDGCEAIGAWGPPRSQHCNNLFRVLFVNRAEVIHGFLPKIHNVVAQLRRKRSVFSKTLPERRAGGRLDYATSEYVTTKPCSGVGFVLAKTCHPHWYQPKVTCGVCSDGPSETGKRNGNNQMTCVLHQGGWGVGGGSGPNV